MRSITKIILLLTEKTNTRLVWDKLGYSEKLVSLMGNGSNSKVKKDLILKAELKLSEKEQGLLHDVQIQTAEHNDIIWSY